MISVESIYTPVCDRCVQMSEWSFERILSIQINKSLLNAPESAGTPSMATENSRFSRAIVYDRHTIIGVWSAYYDHYGALLSIGHGQLICLSVNFEIF